MAKVPVLDLSPFLRAQEKAPRLLMGQTKSVHCLELELELIAATAVGMRLRKHFILCSIPSFSFFRSRLAISNICLSLLISAAYKVIHTKARCDNQQLT